MTDAKDTPAANGQDDQMAQKLMEELKSQGVDIEALQQDNLAQGPNKDKPTDKKSEEKTSPPKPADPPAVKEEPPAEPAPVEEKPTEPEVKLEEGKPSKTETKDTSLTPESKPEVESSQEVTPPHQQDQPASSSHSDTDIQELAKRLDRQFQADENEVLFTFLIKPTQLASLAIVLAILLAIGLLLLFA